ncbi:MAG: transglycosylase domain-containing protein [Erysipelotrichaceae bacterium]|nr:transglycosylase domain-containing protein [Erysipelotrichaceae bacterium]
MKKNKHTQKEQKKRKINKRKILNGFIIMFLTTVVIGGVSVFFILNDILNNENAAKFDQNDLISANSTRVFDSNGEVIAELGKEKRENIEYEQLPQTVIDAFLAIEDSRFFKHNGFDLPRFIKAAIENLSAGSFAQGGSTLTMQMIDNTYFANKIANSSLDKVKFKIQEIFLSMQAEKELSKEEVLTLYLNKINFGDAARGIQKGAQYYFGKDISQVTLSESAFLAGVINAPNLYNPYNGYVLNETTGKATNFYEIALERRNTTLDLMAYHGYITKEECDLAKSTKLAFQLNGKTFFDTDPYQSFLDAVSNEVYELTGDNMYDTSMDIYTTMDRGAQQLADSILDGDVVAFPQGDDNFQVGFTLMNNQNGEILAIGGGRNYSGESRINRAFEEKQPGSSIKPILDYVPAFEHLGWATSHTVVDEPIDIYGTGQMLRNANGQYVGKLPLERAVAESLNTTAAKALISTIDKVGQNEIISFMNKLGYTEISNDNFNLQYSIGGSTMKASPVQMAGAYSALANKGNYIKPHTVRKIVYQGGSKTVENEVEPVKVFSEESAFLMSDILQKAVAGNYYNFLGILRSNYPVYGKTGTSDWGDSGVQWGIPEGVMKDIWMVGYTSNYTVSTWGGYDKPILGQQSYVTVPVNNMNIPGQINKKLLDYIHQNETPKGIEKPEGVVQIRHLTGKYPYTTPPAGTPENLITTGYINKKYASLDTLNVESLSPLTSFNASIKSGTANVLQLQFAPYPDPSKLVDGDSSSFNTNAIFGKVVYKADIKQNGQVIQTFTLSSASGEEVLTNIEPGSTIQVCGYYSYSNAGGKSEGICRNVTLPKKQSSPDSSTTPPSTTPPSTTLPDNTPSKPDNDSSNNNGSRRSRNTK